MHVSYRRSIYMYSRQASFNECLGQLFQQHGESVTQQTLNRAAQIEFTTTEMENCLAALSNQGRIMVSDGEIYKIWEDRDRHYKRIYTNAATFK